ncbi:hypothetical protein HDU97_001089 [Phlyctochytrium planicorne]|nr:hypothetical protein HDU97_001089 [Phlyctochytrium planicorne]
MISITNNHTTTIISRPPCWGYLTYYIVREPRQQQLPRRLASVSLTAKAKIVNSCASVTISQTFELPAASKTSAAKGTEPVEATYQFPLPENAAVCAFECILDDKRIAGIVKEKQEARKEYTEAVEQGKTAGLFEQQAPDVFQVSLGNIESTKVVTHITYIQEVGHDADEEEIRFAILSKNVQDRYGVPIRAETLSNTSATAVPTSTSNPDVPAVSISLEMPNPIMSFQSPSHSSMVLGMGATEANSDSFDPCKARIELDNGSYPDKELVVVAKVKGMNEPVCMVEKHPIDGTHALNLTMVPRFALNEIRSELVVLVDRSGSMEGMKIKQAASALEIFLKSIPAGCFFNIIGFGSSHQMLFPKSKEYGPDSLKQASKHLASLQADLGGTEIESAVKAAFKTRRKDMPTTLFILTDGEVWNVESLMDTVKTEVEESEKSTGKDAYPNAFVRIFSLGIGNDVSHHLVEGIARVGGGFAEFVGETEKLKAKVVKMLKAAVMPPLIDYKIDWATGWKADDKMDEDFEIVGETKPKPALSFFSKEKKPVPPPAPELPESKRMIQQAPFNIPKLWPGVRFNAYAILDPSIPVPGEVTITALSTDGPLNLTIPVVKAKDGLTIHTLAARKLIQDIEEGRSFLNPSYAGPVPEAVARKEIVRLGTKFCLASKHTSFLAVDNNANADAINKKMEEQKEMEKEMENAKMDVTASVSRKSSAGFLSRARVATASFGAPPPQSLGGYQTYGAPAPGGAYGGGGLSLQQLQTQAQSVSVPTAHFRSAPAPKAAKKGGLFTGMFRGGSSSLLATPPPPPAPCVAPSMPMLASAPAPSYAAAPSAKAALDDMDLCLAIPASYEVKKKSKSTVDKRLNMMDAAAVEDMICDDECDEECDEECEEADGDAVGYSLFAAKDKEEGGGNKADDALQALARLQAFDGSFDLDSVARLAGVADVAALKDALKAAFGGLTADAVQKILGCAVAVAFMRTVLKALEDEWDMMEAKAVKFGKGVAGGEVRAWEKAVEIALGVVKA